MLDLDFKMDIRLSLKILLVGIVLICQEVNASHFRGAIISWKPGSRQNEIIIDYRISWRMTYNSWFHCDDSIIQSGALVRAEGVVTCFEGCSGTLGNLSFHCTDYSTIEDWTSGKGRIVTTLNAVNASFGFQGGDWISTLNVGADGHWKLRVKANLSVRSDTGTINFSPTAEITPIVRLQYGCNHTITIPVNDVDHDIVKCRWARNVSDECADVCYAFPNAYLDPDTCTLTYDALYSLGWYAVAIQVEDFANTYDNSPLSSIPVQFLVQVYKSSDSCAARPKLIDPSPQNGDCIVVRKNETFETTIRAHIGGYNRSIAEIKTISPLGMVKSPLMQINSTTWQINVTWAPTAINDTSNVFCFTAKDTSGQQSEKRCITLLSGVSKPSFLDGYQWPTGMVSPDQRQWSVRVDRPFMPGSPYSYIRLYSERGSLLENIGSSNRNAYNHSLEFRTSTTLRENQTYYFLFDSGVVRSNSYCGTESDSEAIRDQYFWRFYTDKVPVRLVNGPNQYSGRVEVYHGGAWGTVCDDSFDRSDAEVICRMLGMLSNDSDIEAFQQAYFGRGSGRIVLDDLQCYGDESSIDQCRSSGWMHENCDHGEDAGVSCHTTVRLVNGTSMYSGRNHYGRVEVYHNGEWGTICDDRFDRYEARVICKQLGLYSGDSHIQVYSNAYFGEGNGSIALDDLDCNGYEQYIGDCRTKPWFSSDCSHSEDVGINCNVSIRLVNGNSNYSGRVEVYHAGEWGTVCDDDFDLDDAQVICRLLGMYYGYGLIKVYTNAYFGRGSGRIALDDLQCSGYETDIDQCRSQSWFSHNCDHSEDAGVDCYAYNEATTSSWLHQQAAETTEGQTPIRLVNGSTIYSGRVEVYHNGAWGTVCDDNVDRNVVRVICKMLGMYFGTSYGVPYIGAYFGEGSGRIALDDLHCYGYETDITQCMRSSWYSNDCSHGEDAGVDCYGYEMTTSDSIETTEVQTPIRLVNGPTYYSGRVEVYHNGAWGTVCDDSTNNRTVKVICKMLGMYIGDSYGRPYSSAYFGQGRGNILLDNLNCNGYESDIAQCMTSSWYTNDCSHSEDFGVDCHGYIYGGTILPYTTRNYFTTTTYRPWYTSTAGYRLADTIYVSCDENGWNIRVNLALLRHIHPGAVASDIYLGENTCTGVESWNTVTFHQGLHECLTSQMIRNNVLVYRNQLVYAQRDPAHPFIIRHYNWTIGVECDVDRNETSSGHIHHDTGSNPVDSVLGSSHYFVNMSFFSDPNFMYRIQGNPIHVAVGTKVYVKVYSTTSDWTIKMKVHTCYTKPTANASDQLKYEIIKNGCEMDSNTHIISQSSHETRFVFEDFEYTSNHEGLYVFCDAIFCRSSDYSRQCMQTCNP